MNAIRTLLPVLMMTAVLSTQRVQAQTGAFDLICHDGRVADKEQLSDWLLGKHKLSGRGWRSLQTDTKSSRQVLDRVVSTDKSCVNCTKEDQEEINALSVSFGLAASAGGVPGVDQQSYFASDSTAEIACSAEFKAYVDGALKPNRPNPISSAWRVRGNVSDLYIDQATDKNAFKASKAASLSIHKDKVTNTDAHSALVFIGHNFDITPGSDRPSDTSVNSLSLIPFVGVDKHKVELDGAFAAEDSLDKRLAGLTAQLFRSVQPNWGYSINLIATHSRDNIDNTRLNQLTAEFEPIVNGRLNDAFTRDSWWVYPRLLFLVDAANFSRRSDRPDIAAVQQNARRAGVDLGVVIYAPGDRLSYGYSYRKLNDWKGDGDVSLFDQYLQFIPDQRNYTALTLRYLRGYKEIGRDPVKKMALELQFRY